MRRARLALGAAAAAGQALALLSAPATLAQTTEPTIVASTPESGATMLIEQRILPGTLRFADRSLLLQNAVLKHCLFQSPRTLTALHEAFEYMVSSAGEMEPLGFGSDLNEAMSERLLTPVASTAFSLSRLSSILHNGAEVPRTLNEVRIQEPALTGLPALERLMLMPEFAEEVSFRDRCNLAVAIAANIRDTALGVLRGWQAGRLVAHWRSDQTELASRRRQRDLIQGMIDTIDVAARDAASYANEATGNETLPFAGPKRARLYLDGMAKGLIAQAATLEGMVGNNDAISAVLRSIVQALDQARDSLRPNMGPEAVERMLAAYAQAQSEIVESLPELFDFDPTAFTRPLPSLTPPSDEPPQR